MQYGILKDVDWKLMGALLADKGDVEQADFLKSFIKECLSWGTRHQVEMQLAFVNNKLTSDERRVLSMLSYEEGQEVT